ncbi:TPA: MAE_28990/MAE_18760 family HEPN-like nuclease [Providencia alcalifaciens]
MADMKSRILFDERANDIEEYFSFIGMLINKKPSLSYQDGSSIKTERISMDMTHILKSNTWILLYNLIEATISNAIEDIHDEILSNNSLSADLLCINLTKIALKNIDESTINDFDYGSFDASKIILDSWLKKHKSLVENNKNPLFSGNVDAKKIRKIADSYGFSFKTDKNKTRNGACLVNIKNSRNSLAHGSNSFREKGRETSIDELLKFKKEVIYYLDGILDNIESYIYAKKFLRQPITSDL